MVAAATTALVSACRGGGRGPNPSSRGALPSENPGPGTPIVVGCIAPFSGPYAAVGQIVSASLAAATGHIDHDLHGSYGGYRPTIVNADAPLTPADGQRAYAQLVSQRVDAVLWCGAQGLAESLPAIVADLVPVIAVGTDLQGRVAGDAQVPDLTTAGAAGFPVFQTSLPDSVAVDLLLRYAATDRGFTRAALVWSTSSAPGADGVFAAACARHGIANVGTPGYDSSTGSPNLGVVVNALRSTKAEAVVVLGSALEAASLATILDQMGAGYVDTPTAKASRFAPMVLGVPAATATALFTRTAGVHAARGTGGASTLGAVVGLPEAPIRDWVRRFVPGYNGGLPQGGEEGPADALAAVLGAAATARSSGAADVIAALEAGSPVQFATSVPWAFGPDRHLSVSAGDLAMQSVEYEPQPRYQLGQDWATVFPTGYRAPDLLVDFTLATNRQAHPAVMSEVLGMRYGISGSYQGGDPAKISACAAVH